MMMRQFIAGLAGAARLPRDAFVPTPAGVRGAQCDQCVLIPGFNVFLAAILIVIGRRRQLPL